MKTTAFVVLVLCLALAGCAEIQRAHSNLAHDYAHFVNGDKAPAPTSKLERFIIELNDIKTFRPDMIDDNATITQVSDQQTTTFNKQQFIALVNQNIPHIKRYQMWNFEFLSQLETKNFATVAYSYEIDMIVGDARIIGSIMSRDTYGKAGGTYKVLDSVSKAQLAPADSPADSRSGQSAGWVPSKAISPRTGLLPDYNHDAYGYGSHSDATGRPFTYRTRRGRKVYGPVNQNGYGLGVHTDQYGRPVYAVPRR